MATILFRLEERTTRDGMHPVKMRINHMTTTAWMQTSVWVEPEYFNKDSLREPIYKKAYMASSKNGILRDIVARFDQVMYDINRDTEMDLCSITATDIRSMIMGEKKSKKKKQVVVESKTGRLSFLDWFDQYGQSRKTEGTKKSYAYIWRVLNEYCKSKGKRQLYFDEIDYIIFVSLRKWLEETGRGESVRYQVEAYMHAAWREAKRMKMVSGTDPWEDYKIERVSIKENIDVIELKDLRRLLSLDLTRLSGVDGLTKARDILWASFCLCGVNLTDIYHMPKMKSEEVVYIRRKSRNNKNVRATHVYINNDLESVIARYEGKAHLFNFQEKVPNYSTFQRRVNDRCSRLSDILGVQVNMAIIRRTWSTIAGDIGVDFHAVEKMTGHIDTSTTDKHYQRFNWSNAAKQNQRVIDYVLRGVTQNSIQVPSKFK